MKLTRRQAIGSIAGTVALQTASAQPPAPGSAELNWIDGAPPEMETGVSWGISWPRGEVNAAQTFSLANAAGKSYPLQQWPLAYWPDGSIKWTGFATVAGNDANGLRVSKGAGAASPVKLTVRDDADSLTVDTGSLQCQIRKQGTFLFDSLSVSGVEVARQARLQLTLENRGAAPADRVIRFEDFTSVVRKVTTEQTGPVRGVIKAEGIHRADQGSREWLPFTVRLYFYAGCANVRAVHTIVFDGDDQKDFIRALGLTVSVPMREEVHNRHIRFSGEGDGLWEEPVQPVTGRRVLALPNDRTGNLFANQLAGKRLPNKSAFDARGKKLLGDWAVWDEYKLVQPTPDAFTVHKRANAQSCFLDAAGGGRASGMVFAGDVSGGLGISLKNFWQSYPASLEVTKASTSQADVHVWMWSPDAPAMDMRHYDTRAHDLDSSYEDVQPGYSTPHGVARTSEIMLFASAGLPSREDAVKQAKLGAQAPVPAATPAHLYSTKVFGVWSLPDRSTPAKKSIEDQLDASFDLYHKEVDQRRWYGFWNYGDVMHQHDGPRHMWRYDVGGFAWDNTELGTDMWLWYTFLRSGRADVFRMAEAMTRHTSEVDVYHLGRFAGLGSRHNVRHWGCGAKEPRISQAAYRRFYYYLTTDERTGDLMREVLDSDRKTIEIDPMRLASPLTAPLRYPGRVRGGPDWLAFIGNWMTEWERTGNTKYRDRIVAGFDSVSAMKYRFFTGPNSLMGYDPATGKLFPLSEDGFGGYNLTTIMGGAEVVFELNELIDHPGWKAAWLQYCRINTARPDVVLRDIASGAEGADARFGGPGRLSGYVYAKTKNVAFAKKALQQLAGQGPDRPRLTLSKLKGPDVLNPVEEATGVSTNSVAQAGLHAIELLELCRDQIG